MGRPKKQQPQPEEQPKAVEAPEVVTPEPTAIVSDDSQADEEVKEELEAIKEEEQSKPEPPKPHKVDVDMSHSSALVLSTGNVSHISKGDDPKGDPNLVKVRVSYPHEWKGKRYMQEGKVYEVSPETAEIFLVQGIAEKV